MAKMFYTQAEAAAKLGKTPDGVKQMVRDGRLREFMDNGPVYRIEDIDKLAKAEGGPVGADAVDLELAEETAGEGDKEGTVITSAGISVFDDADLQIEADPMAQTSITPSVEDQISLEGTGSGSGLLDLTREADDTSLGAELLEEIYPAAPAAVGPAEAVMEAPAGEAAVEAPVGFAPAVIQAPDALGAAFAGMALAGLLATGFLAVLVASIVWNVWPDFLKSLSKGDNPYYLGGGLVAAAALLWLIGLLIGRSVSSSRT